MVLISVFWLSSGKKAIHIQWKPYLEFLNLIFSHPSNMWHIFQNDWTILGDSGQQQWAELLAAVSWAPGQPWNHERKQPTHLHSFCTHTTILVFTFSVCVLSCCCRVRLFVTLWTVAQQAPLSMEFSRQEYCSGLSCPPPGDLPHPGIEPVSFMSPSLAGRFFTTSITWEAPL